MPGFYDPHPESEDTPIEAAFRQRARQLADHLKTEARRVELAAETARSRRGASVLRLLAERLGISGENIRESADEDFPGPHPRPFRFDGSVLREWVQLVRDERFYDDVETLADVAWQVDRLSKDWPDFDSWEFLKGERLRDAKAVWGR